MDAGLADPLRALTTAAEPRRARLRVGAGAVVVLLLVAIGCAVLVTALSPAGGTSTVESAASGRTDSDSGTGADPGSGAPTSGSSGSFGAGSPDSIGAGPEPDGGAGVAGAEPSVVTVMFVHVLGAVSRPGLYELDGAARVVDAIAAAGGLTDTADTARVNLARPVADGEQLYVPSAGEVVTPLAGSGAGGVGAGGVGAAGASPPSSIINLNTATAADLDTLPRIGPALAQRILDWRASNGRFSAVDDLLSVPGIGDKIVDGLRALVVV